MSGVCILTDSTAQFTTPNFPGNERVFRVQFTLQPGSSSERSTSKVVSKQQLVPPQADQFLECYSRLGHSYESILAINLSSSLSPAVSSAIKAAGQYNNHASIRVVDSQTTAVGLGLLVQEAALAAANGATLEEVERVVRVLVPHVFMLICVPELSYLHESGYLEYSQAFVGEMLGIIPVFNLEEGRLTPLEKVRTQRHLLEAFQEFLGEYEDPQHVAVLRGMSHNPARARQLREFMSENFPGTSFSEHTWGRHLAALFGPQSLGLVIMEKGEKIL